MMADMDRVELLMGLSNNMRQDNEEWRRAVYREGQERAKRVLEMIRRFEAEYAALDQERQSLSQYLPRQQEQLPRAEQMPKVVQQGPKQ
jgi:hypothetical protein